MVAEGEVGTAAEVAAEQGKYYGSVEVSSFSKLSVFLHLILLPKTLLAAARMTFI